MNVRSIRMLVNKVIRIAGSREPKSLADGLKAVKKKFGVVDQVLPDISSGFRLYRCKDGRALRIEFQKKTEQVKQAMARLTGEKMPSLHKYTDLLIERTGGSTSSFVPHIHRTTSIQNLENGKRSFLKWTKCPFNDSLYLRGSIKQSIFTP